MIDFSARIENEFSTWLDAARLNLDSAGLSAALATQAGLPVSHLREVLASRFDLLLFENGLFQATQIQRGVIPISECRKRGVLPFLLEDGSLAIAVDDPWQLDVTQWLIDKLGSPPTLIWSESPTIVKFIEEMSDASTSTSFKSDGVEHRSQGGAATFARVITSESIEASSSPIIRFVDATILDAWKSGASDIHFEARRDGLRIKFRLDGVLVSAGAFEGNRPVEEVLNRIKVLAQLDVGETRLPQDGRFRVMMRNREIDLRVSIMPSIHGEDAVVRLLDKAQLRDEGGALSLAGLGLPNDVIATIRQLAKEPHGMLLVTGPTGSGKTTTLYAVLSEIQNGGEKIITIEDPVEYELPRALQIPVNEKKGLTFAKGLRSILRHDPDRILVGEIRDPETAEIAVQAALTGHLVFTTVHANNVYDVVGRFLHMGVDPYNFMSALVGVVAQRLVRMLCSDCSRPDNSHAIVEYLRNFQVEGQALTPRLASGCTSCRQTGYRGRHAIAEVLPVDDIFREMVIQRQPVRFLREHIRELGIISLRHRALQLVAQGATTLEEIDRVVSTTN